MKRITFVLLAAGVFVAGCQQPPVTRFAHGKLKLDVSGKIIAAPADKTAAVFEPAPDTYYTLDTPTPQIMLKVRVVSPRRTHLRSFGLWFGGGRFYRPTGVTDTTSRSGAFALTVGVKGGSRRGSGRTQHVHGPSCETGKCLAGGTTGTGAGTGAGVTFPFIGAGGSTVTSAKILFAPKIVALNDFREAYFVITVIPHITAEQNASQIVFVPLVVVSEVAEDIRPDPSKAPTSTVLVTTDNKIILDGLVTDEVKAKTKIPLLGDLPLIGGLFRSTTTAKEKTEVLIFLKPYVVMERE